MRYFRVYTIASDIKVDGSIRMLIKLNLRKMICQKEVRSDVQEF